MREPAFTELRELRARYPELIAARAAERRRRPLLGADGRLMIVAADHPARGSLGVRGVANAMADRYDLLRRLLGALSRPGVDGLLATADIIEDLLLLGALEDKVVFGSMNRGGLQGASFELDDRFTAYDVATIAGMGLDGGKMLTRIDPSDPGTAATLEAAGRAVTELGSRGLVAMLEPFMCHHADARVVNDLSAPAVIRSVAIASGLGATSGYSWLKLPVTDGMEEVMAATTLPTLLLGGDPVGPPEKTYGRWAAALALPGVRGFVIGRALLYPHDGDVAAAVDAAVTDCACVPLECACEITTESGGRFALACARARAQLPFRHVTASEVRVELRGAGACSRRVSNFGTPDVLEADRLIACEVVTPAGNWSSFPPHKHDTERPGESALEETYYFEVADGPVGPGLAYQRVYGTPERPADVLAEVRSGDVVIIPHGWHGPSMAVPGYDLYYLNVMAGPGQRAWLICDDPAHSWVREQWRNQPADPRVSTWR